MSSQAQKLPPGFLAAHIVWLPGFGSTVFLAIPLAPFPAQMPGAMPLHHNPLSPTGFVLPLSEYAGFACQSPLSHVTILFRPLCGCPDLAGMSRGSLALQKPHNGLIGHVLWLGKAE